MLGFVTVGAPYLLLGGFPAPGRGPLAWFGLLCIVIGARIYFSCGGEFAVRGLGTPAKTQSTFSSSTWQETKKTQQLSASSLLYFWIFPTP